ncbi:MAG TPA: nucleotidyltransferase domain-containing protein [Spirochaetota bacterium]|nr:nucleotidyltransferase domain-containing protein [Spirochaetota bacterium]HPR38015.1 nucleotidyltransferase domain-containing protein [Spirochaetota bacterium]HRX48174.1 nucleotidyltransferase domain-containing protein [Spirochaetota bacterium]
MLSETKINSIRDIIIEKFDPAAIYLFGSYAKGEAREQSDLDLLIINRSSIPDDRVGIEISKALFPRDYSLDLFVLNTDEMKKRLKNDSKFWNNILKHSKKIYVRK